MSPGLRRPAHPLRRPDPLGRRREPVAAARRDDGRRRQLRVHHRAGDAASVRLREGDAGAGRGDARSRRLEAALDFGWSTIRRVARPARGAVAVNAGFLVGHSTVRRLVMGEAAVGETATRGPARRDGRRSCTGASRRCARASRPRGRRSHRDHHGDPVPSLPRRRVDEVLALCAAVRDHEGTILEIVPSSRAATSTTRSSS